MSVQGYDVESLSWRPASLASCMIVQQRRSAALSRSHIAATVLFLYSQVSCGISQLFTVSPTVCESVEGHETRKDLADRQSMSPACFLQVRFQVYLSQ